MSDQRNSSYAFRQKRERLLAQPDACCVVCGATAEQTQLHIDHVYPYALAKAAGWTDAVLDGWHDRTDRARQLPPERPADVHGHVQRQLL